ncbi:hypothetical protein N865_05330 [Intrasporangium oryzae NRRL B-24470]|uniref:Methyltransferase domain-containing protein n=1 Tax=Intrasporangium oryzae NRRL B-24470 TaxID=1386089 RepID=W9G8L0_9MICO|nr:class I SAM-dependent methyltransferase [Intrasporangium oryzae]EWT02506.1 hypothetical protein N865_05330 [Intrasporangium oryzae NRRL B-24470]
MAFDDIWSAYNEAQLGREPRELCRAVVAQAGPGRGRLAVDLGCGSGVETRALLNSGWRVIAVDSEPSTPARLASQIGSAEGLEIRVQSFQELDLGRVDLVHAAYALPFIDPTDFPSVWQRLRDALNPGGWLAVDLFGDRDEWAETEGMTFLNRSQVGELLEGLDVVRLDEEDEDGCAFTGPKHWHVFHVLARQA